jgi:hypothetical protein
MRSRHLAAIIAVQNVSGDKCGESLLFGVVYLYQTVKAGSLKDIPHQASGVADLEFAASSLQQFGSAEDHSQARAAEVVELFEIEQDPLVFASGDIHNAISRIT